MHFAETYFGKTLDQVRLSDVEEFFFSPREETATLEFKSGGVSYNDIFKEIASFLNSEGGLLIIGAPREQRKWIGGKEIKMCCGPLDLSVTIKDKDTFVRQMAMNISPEPVGVNIHHISTHDGSVYLVEVAPSNFPPHQVLGEGRYYVRDGATSVPAGHDQVRQLFFKTTSSDVKIRIHSHWTQGQVCVELVFFNESSVPAGRLTVQVRLYGVSGAAYNGVKFKTSEAGSAEEVYYDFFCVPFELPRCAEHGIGFDVQLNGDAFVTRTDYWASEGQVRREFWLISETEVPRRFDLKRSEDLLELQAYLTSPEERLGYL